MANLINTRITRDGWELWGEPLVIMNKGAAVRQVVLEDGTAIPCGGIFFKQELVTDSDLPQAIGCRLTETGMIVVDEFRKMNVPGVYSVGDDAEFNVLMPARGISHGKPLNRLCPIKQLLKGSTLTEGLPDRDGCLR